MNFNIRLPFFSFVLIASLFSCRGGAYVEEKGKSGISALGMEDSLVVVPVPDSLFRDLGEGLKMAILRQGDGEQVKIGSNVTLNYIGVFEDGKEFENSQAKKAPFSFVPGQGTVIDGWEKAIPQLRFGTKAVIEVPPQLAYGKEGREPTIPPNATLLFYVNVLGEF